MKLNLVKLHFKIIMLHLLDSGSMFKSRTVFGETFKLKRFVNPHLQQRIAINKFLTYVARKYSKRKLKKQRDKK